MPAMYEAIKRSVKAELMDKGMDDAAAEKEAAGHAARIYNSKRPTGAAPVTGKHHSPVKYEEDKSAATEPPPNEEAETETPEGEVPEEEAPEGEVPEGEAEKPGTKMGMMAGMEDMPIPEMMAKMQAEIDQMQEALRKSGVLPGGSEETTEDRVISSAKTKGRAAAMGVPAGLRKSK